MRTYNIKKSQKPHFLQVEGFFLPVAFISISTATSKQQKVWTNLLPMNPTLPQTTWAQRNTLQDGSKIVFVISAKYSKKTA